MVWPKPFAEHRFARGDCFVGVHLVETSCSPRLLIAFDDERRGVLVESVAVRLKDAVLVLDEEESERVKRQSRAEPRESSRACVEVRLEIFGVFPANSAVDTVGCDYQVGVAKSKRSELTVVVDVRAEAE